MKSLQSTKTPAIINGGGVCMGRDLVKRRASNAKWNNEKSKSYGLRISNSTGIPDALEAATALSGMTTNAYVTIAIREKLIRDGYLKPLDETISELSDNN